MKNRKLNVAANIFFPLALIVYSLLLVNQGITVTDTGYNYGNFVHFNQLDPMWKFSTYLATALGNLFTKLPYGHTLLGLNLYTGLVKALVALVVYYSCVYAFRLRKELVFFGELVALGFCWCPTALLYNYVTYLLFNVSAILLCLAIRDNRKSLYICAGAALGLNVLVRVPNLAEIALIFALWFYCLFRKISFKDTVCRTLLCILGYLLGLGSGISYIFIKYGPSAYIESIRQILSMSDDSNGYSVKTMLLQDYYAYRNNLKWLILAILLILAGFVLYQICKERFLWGKRIIYLICNVVLVCLYYHWGVFRLTYYNYSAMYQIGVLFLLLAGCLGLYVMFFGGEHYELRMHAMVMGIILLITPLGSNNQLYSAENNLFLAVPFVLECIRQLYKEKNISPKKLSLSTEPLLITLCTLVLVTAIQGILFGATFVFRDGINGEKRTAQITDNSVLANVYTNEANASTLNELNTYLVENHLKGKEVLLYQNVASLSFYMEMSPAISTTWPDLDSYSIKKLESELTVLKEKYENTEDKPVVILGAALDETNPKVLLLRQYLADLDYSCTFSNEAYLLYQ